MTRGRSIALALWIVALGVGVGVGAVTTKSLDVIGIAGIIVVLIGAYVVPPSMLLATILLLIFIDKSPVVVHGTYVRFYMPVAGAFILRTLRLWRKHWAQFHWLLLAWLLSYIPALGLHPPMHAYLQVVLGDVFLIALCVSVYAFIADSSPDTISRQIQWLWWGGVIVIASGLADFVLHAHGGTYYRPSGFEREPNWYGTVCAIMAPFTAALMEDGRIRRDRGLAVLIASVVGCVLALSRGGWLQLAVGLWIVWRKKIRISSRVALSAIYATVLVGVLGISAAVWSGSGVVGNTWRAVNPATLLVTKHHSAESHFYALELMVKLWRTHPVFGLGAGIMGSIANNPVYRALYAGGGVINGGHGSTNLLMNEAVEAGLVGTAMLVAWIVSYIRGVDRRSYLWPSLVGLFWAFEINNGVNFGFVWVMIGVLGGMSAAKARGRLHAAPELPELSTAQTPSLSAQLNTLE